MVLDQQLFEHEATGWKRGVYEDVKRTFRAPVVNGIFRVPMARHPAVARYAWGQIKPVFETRALAEFTAAYRDAILSGLDERFGLPSFRPADVEVAPGEFRELQGQLATFDVVAPRLAVTIELLHRGTHGEPVGQRPDESRAATEPIPPDADRDRGRPVTLLEYDEVPDSLSGVTESVRERHGFGEGIATIHQCTAQWPGYFEAAWEWLDPVLGADGYDPVRERAESLVAEFVDSIAYTPRLAPDDLRGRGFDDDAIEDLQEVFAWFQRGPPRTVLRTLPVYAALVGADGPRAI